MSLYTNIVLYLESYIDYWVLLICTSVHNNVRYEVCVY